MKTSKIGMNQIVSPTSEMLERRLCFSTFSPFISGYNTQVNWTGDSDNAGKLAVESGQYDQYDSPIYAKGDTVTCNITNLPKHTMVRVKAIVDSEAYHDNGETCDISFGSRHITLDRLDNDGILFVDNGSNNNRWTAHTEDSLTVTFDASGLDSNAVDVPISLSVSLYVPVVKVEGGGSTDEDNAGNAVFTVSADEPTGWAGTSAGDSAIAAVHVDLDKHGTADEGTDYTIEPDVVVPARSQTSDPASTQVPLTVLDDSEAEGIETVLVSVTSDSNSNYEAANGEAEADIDDNVSITSVTAHVYNQPGDTQNNPLFGGVGYRFNVVIEVSGEHLDRVYITQKVLASSSFFDDAGDKIADGQALAQAQAFAQAHNRPFDPNLVNTQIGPNGDLPTDTGWDWQGLQIDPNSHNGIGRKGDLQAFLGLGLQNVSQIPGNPQSPNVTVSDLAETTRYFKDYFSTVLPDSDPAIEGRVLLPNTFEWGYDWNNYGSLWNNNPYIGKHWARADVPGLFSGQFGITGL